ncbi:hypothetical protein OIO90_004500 [Microbotryomycetes sp. JL221]|nr:hypothetical protein OIO90_004500 [Microbotryomycetes sp. JL221]
MTTNKAFELSDVAQELLRVREQLVRSTAKGKAKAAQQPVHDDVQLTSDQVRQAYSLALHTIRTGPPPAVSSTTANTMSMNAMDIVQSLLTRSIAVIEADRPLEEQQPFVEPLDTQFLLDMANAIYTLWDSGPTLLMQKCRTTLGPLLTLCDLVGIDKVKLYLRDKCLLEPWHSKRTINVFSTMQRHLDIEQLRPFCSTITSYEMVEVGILARLTQAMTTAEEVSAVAGAAAYTWIERVWQNSTVDDLFWIKPVAKGCRTRGVTGRNNVCLHLLPAIFKKQGTRALEALLEQGGFLESTTLDLQAALEVLEVGNSFKLLRIGEHDKDQGQSAAPDGLGPPRQYIVPHALLDQCLRNANPSMRCSALSLLVLTTATASPLSPACLDHIRTFYTNSLGEEDSSFRMSCQSLSGRLLIRLRASAWRAHRTCLKPNNDDVKQAAQSYVNCVKTFIEWWSNLLFQNLNPAKPFRIKMSALRLLDLLFQANVDDRFGGMSRDGTNEVAGNDPTSGYSTYRRVVPTHHPQFHAKHRKIDDGSTVGQLGQDASAWPFKVELVTPSTTFVLLRQMQSTFTALRALALSLLEKFPSPLPGYEGQEGEVKARNELMQPALRMIRSGRDAEASAGAGVIGLVWRKWLLESNSEGWKLSEISSFGNKLKATQGPAGFSFLNGLMDLLETQIDSYRMDLAHAASTTPMHGTILALRHLFVSIPLSAFDRLSTVDERRTLFERALLLIEQVWQVTSPVLAASAPEGTAELQAQAADTEEARAVHFEQIEGADDVVEEAEGHGGPMHKIILSATWRAMKEAGELLETILRLPSELGPEVFKQIWSLNSIKHIGGLFAEWLARIRHRGGYMAVSPCYARACAALLSCKGWPEAAELPFQWLTMHIDSILEDDVSTTRRSAGVPFCIVGLLITMMPVDMTRTSRAIERLFKIAESKSVDVRDRSRVHAMNTLRTAFLDAKCTTLVNPYIERGFLVSIALFWSSNWICRNVAMLTYSALVTRAFSSRRINLKRDHLALQHRLTADDFFGRFPALHKVLQHELEYCSREHLDDLPTSDLHSSLFSILMLLSLVQTTNRVDPLAPSPTDVFVPVVRKCAKSRVWKIRDVAGDALSGLVPSLKVPTICVDILSQVESQDENEVHGKLVQVLRVLQATGPLPSSDLTQLHASVDRLAPLLDDGKHSFAVGATIFDIARLCFSLHGYKSTLIIERAYERLDQTRLIGSGSINAHLPSAENYVAAAFSLVLIVDQDNRQTLLRAGMSSRFLEVQRRALNYFNNVVNDDDDDDNNNKEEQHVTNKIELLLTLKQDLIKLVLDEQVASECRIMGLDQLVQIDDWNDTPLETLLSSLLQIRQNSRIVPLREALLPLIAKVADAAGTSETVLELINCASSIHESIESRESSVKALYNISSTKVVKSDLFGRLVLRLLQDDDVTVRQVANDIVARWWTNNVGVCERVAVKSVLDTVGEPGFDQTSDEFDSDMQELLKPTSLLFAIEKPNIFKDDLLEREVCLNAYVSNRSSNVIDKFKQIVSRSNDNQGPLSLFGDDFVCKWSYRLEGCGSKEQLETMFAC